MKWIKFHDFGTGAFRNPIFLRYRTMNGVAVSVQAIRTGAKTLWTAYATTNVLAPVANFDSRILWPIPIFVIRPTMSIPLKRMSKNYTD